MTEAPNAPDGGEASAASATAEAPAKPRRPPIRGAVDVVVRQLLERAPRLGQVLLATTPRGDVRAVRARLLLLLLRLRCPLEGLPARRWYVAGAAARVGAEGLRRAWGELVADAPAPSLRRLRDHLAAMEQVLLLVRQPGDWLPRLELPGDAAPRRHRWPDTFHVLERDADAEWWATQGRALLVRHPECRTNPSAWATHVGDWRRRQPVQQELFRDVAAALSADRDARAADPVVARADDLRRAGQLAQLVAEAPPMPAAVLARLDAAGVALRGTNRALAARNPDRLLGAAALLAVALRRGRTVHNRSGWIVSAWRRARSEEMAAAVRALAGESA